MNQLDYLLYILSQSVASIKPKLIVLLKEWHEQFSCEEPKEFKPTEFCRALDLSKNQTQKFCELFNTTSPTQITHTLKQSQVTALNIFSDKYPALLNHTPDPPLILYCRGNIELFDITPVIAVVGSRRATKYGELAVQKIISGLVNQPIIIASGLAYGIDAITHRAALTNSLPTIAVLGSGLASDYIYPRENFQLAQDILNSNGLLVSEYPPNTEARQHQFIARNRIIAGLSVVVIIAEAASKSGALITADFAIDYNRTVMAVPGSILSPTSSGPHQLIQHGAALLQSATELLQELNLESAADNSTRVQLTEQEATVLEYIKHETLAFDQLVITTSLPAHQLQVILSSLILRSIVKEVGSQIYQVV